MSSRLSILALAVAAALPTAASAVDFSYSGFSTAAYSQTDTDEAAVGYIGQPEGVDKGGSWEFDSKLGVQVTAKFNDILSATVQGVAYTDLTGDWEPRVDWAYVRAQATQSLSFRAGYLRAPTFMYSDSVFIGYANVWVRPPLEVYNTSPVYQLRGVDATYRTQLGGFTVTVNPYAGEGEIETAATALDVKNWFGLATTVNYGSFQARVGYGVHDVETSANLSPLNAALLAVPASACGACASIAKNLTVDGAQNTNLNLGVQYDDGSNFVATEFAKAGREAKYIMPNLHSAYLTYGRRFGNLMPYATVAGIRRESPRSTNAIPAVGQLAVLSAGVNAMMQRAGATDQDSYSLGLRYELPSFSVINGAIVKLQFDHIETDVRGGLILVQPGFDGKVDMISASFDFIF